MVRESAEKCGFKQEGVLREAGYKNGRYFDILVMGILESEWRESHPPEN
ncbi:MAG: GNAT family N-acetyltransferase [Anaerolineae bacterium]